VIVPEPEAKARLRARDIAVPAGVVLDADGIGDGVEQLHDPVVIKAFGDGIVHKSDVGAVRLGLDVDEVPTAIFTMRSRLAAEHRIFPDGFLVEEQAPPGVELLVGAVRSPFGVTVTVGLGGVLAEVLDDVAVGLAPLDRGSVEVLLDRFRGASLLRGYRGAAPVDRDALVTLLLALAGPGGLALDDDVAELDCNPVIASPDGVVVADARFVKRDHVVPTPERRPLDVDALFAPRSIAIAGVSTSKPGFGNRALAAYRAFGWTDNLSVIHPSATEVDGVPAYPSPRDVPGGIDYLLCAVPAMACGELVRDAAGVARVAQVITGGFAEGGADGHELEEQLRDAALVSGVRVVGPNCIGVYAPAGRQTFQLGAPTEVGAVSVVSQSGGLAGDIVKVGAARGLRFSKVLSIGNAVDVTSGEVVEHYVDADATRVIGVYIEGSRDGQRLVEAFRAARDAGKPVVVLTGGLSEQGSAAVVSHTGALTGDRRVWQAIEHSTGCAVVERLEDLLGALVFAQRYADHLASGDDDVLVVGVGGGASVLAADACDRAGLRLAPVPEAARGALRALGYGAGTSVANPVEIGVGPAAPVEVFEPVLDAVLTARAYPDILLHVNVQAYSSYGTAGVEPLIALLRSVGAALDGARYPASRVVMVTRNLDVASGADADAVLGTAVEIRLPVYRTFDEAAVAIAAGKQFARARTPGPERPGAEGAESGKVGDAHG
jgi:acyl-CoA synthetase (NDP forming)